MFILVPTWDGISTLSSRHFLDASQCASIANRRFYRQGINWALAGITAHTPGWNGSGPAYYTRPNGTVTLSKLPNTWVTSGAWEKTFRAWQRQQNEAIQDGMQQSVRAKFNDFKIHANADHVLKGAANNLLPVTHSPGEWDMSQIVIPNYGAPGNNYEPYIHAVGDDVGGLGGSIGMIKAYANSRGVPQSPDPVVPATVTSTENFLNAMFDVGDNNEDVMDNVVLKNDELPYPQEDYPGADIQSPALEIFGYNQITATTIGGTTRFGGTNLPCGLIEISNTTMVYDNPEYSGSPLPDKFMLFELDFIPGGHRGYLCEPMTEM